MSIAIVSITTEGESTLLRLHLSTMALLATLWSCLPWLCLLWLYSTYYGHTYYGAGLLSLFAARAAARAGHAALIVAVEREVR